MNRQPSQDEFEARVNKLEELFSHQEKMIEQLNEVVTSLQSRVQRIEDLQTANSERLKWIVENASSSDFDPDEKPPHY